jgi:hypothetical protein
MSYLVCDKCGGCYELQEGESSEDFSDKCECGGKLKSIKSDTEFDLDKNSSMGIRIIAILIGLIIIILCLREMPFIILVVAGFVTGYIAGGSYKDGIFNSAVVGGIGGIFAFLFFISSYFLLEGKYFCAYHTTVFAISYIIPSMLLCLIGGIIAIFIKNRFKG